MNKSRFLISVLILIFNQFSAVGAKFTNYPTEDDTLKLIEKVYLHIDRENYLAGDDIWFKAYLIDALDHLLTDHSNNLHVELISPSSKIISSRIIRLDDGLGNGDFKLPADIKSGRYRLRAYTNYMRNFGDQLFFSKEITIVNAKDNGQIGISENVNYVENKISVVFFPEGGSLVDNVTSIVAFKAVNNLEIGCDVSGKIYSSKGDMITTFRSTHRGMGKFFLRPSPGLRYYSIIRGADSIDIRTELPASFAKGVTLNAVFNQDNELLITIKTNSETLALVSENNMLLSISIRKELISTIPFRIKSPVTNFVVPTAYLPEGILMLTLSTRDDLPLSERLIYLEREAPLKMLVETDKQLYTKREQVNLRISLSGDSTIEKEGNVSLSVVNETFTDKTSQFPRTISSWFLLESDIRGKIEDPSYYFDPSNTERLINLDLLLRTQGWRDFTWKYDTTYFSPENGFTISGRIRYIKKKSVADSRVSLGIFGSGNIFMRTVPVDSMDRFKLTGIDLNGNATLIATGIGKNNHPEGFLTLDSMVYNPAIINDSLLNNSVITESNHEKLKTSYKINAAIKKKYKLSDTISIGEVKIISERHKDPQTIKIEQSRSKYLKPESELILTEQMVGYKDMIQLLKGKIPGLLVVGDTGISIRGFSSIKNFSQPLILIDGNQASFVDLLDMPIVLVDRIDVLKSVGSTVIYGLKASGGVINIITKAGGMPISYNPPEYSVKHRISGYNEPRIFYSPQHLQDANSDQNPDLRSTIYWKPNLVIEGTGESIVKFYNSDNTSRVSIIAEGITKNGIPVSGKAEYDVK